MPRSIPSSWSAIALYAAVSLFGFAIACGYVVALTEGAFPSFLTAWFALYLLGKALFDAGFCWWLTRPLRILREGPDAAAAASAMRMDSKVFWALVLQLSVLLMPPVIFAAGWSPDAARQILFVAVASSVVQATIGSYAFVRYSARLVGPVVLTTTEGFRIKPMWHHIAVLVGILGILLPLGFTLLMSGPTPRMDVVSYLSVHFLLVGLFVAYAAARAIYIPAKALESAMEEVARGELQAHAPIQGLDTMGALTSHFNAMVGGLRERERIRQVFGRYVATQVADEILAGRIELGGELRVATVLFTDIRGFTAMSEKMEPTAVIGFLNAYFEHMVGCVIENGGVLDKFIGDAIMALFGVPIARSPEEDARAAVRCAVEMRLALATLNTERGARGEPPLEMGIGIHTGDLVVGNIGTKDRTEYTVIGDAVNLASRLEGMTKTLGQPVLISEATAALLGDMDLTELGAFEVRGRQEKVTLFTVAA